MAYACGTTIAAKVTRRCCCTADSPTAETLPATSPVWPILFGSGCPGRVPAGGSTVAPESVAFVGQSTLLGALATLGLTALTFYTFSSHTFTSGSAPVGQLGGPSGSCSSQA